MAEGEGKTDISKWRKLLENVKGAKDSHVKVGVLASAGDVEGGQFSLAELAAVHEYGSPENGIPERSFIRSTMTASKEEMAKRMEKIARNIVQGEGTIAEGLDQLGLWVSSKIKSRIVGRQIVPRLEDSEAGRRTIERKDSDVTLVDTAQLLNAISWQVVEGGSE